MAVLGWLAGRLVGLFAEVYSTYTHMEGSTRLWLWLMLLYTSISVKLNVKLPLVGGCGRRLGLGHRGTSDSSRRSFVQAKETRSTHAQRNSRVMMQISWEYLVYLIEDETVSGGGERSRGQSMV